MVLGEVMICIFELQDEIQIGFVCFNIFVSLEIERVSFLFDNCEVFVKNMLLFNVEFDLGDFLKIYILCVEGIDVMGEIVVEDEIEINLGC